LGYCIQTTPTARPPEEINQPTNKHRIQLK
jgi:hypothetical protein